MELIHATEENFDQLITENPLVLVDFWASCDLGPPFPRGGPDCGRAREIL